MSQALGMEPAQWCTAELAGAIGKAWRDRWDEWGTFNADNPVEELAGPLAQEKPFSLLDMFPYPSGKGLHVEHPLGYIATDTVARFRRVKGENVLYTMGYDAFGLSAEQYAVQTSQHPWVTTEENIANMRRQLRRLGLSHDRRRSLATTDAKYVHRAQWIFLQIFNSWPDPEAITPDGSQGAARPISELGDKLASGEVAVPDERSWAELDRTERTKVVDSFRLTYVSEAPANWCPGLGIVLANEEVTSEGRSERGNYLVFTRNLRQWMMWITAYGRRLADDLDTIDWPEKIRAMRRNQIGRSEGAAVTFEVPGARTAGASQASLDVYTTRPDTLFGATFMVVAPERPILGGTLAGNVDDAVQLGVPDSWPEGTKEEWTGNAPSPREAVVAYCAQAAARTESECTNEERVKTGVFTGFSGINPVNGRPIPVFAVDYVLWGYDTDAIMAVPAYDDRDWEFARKYALEIIRTIGPAKDPYSHNLDESAFTGDGLAVDSSNEEISLDELAKDEAKAAMTERLETKGPGRSTITYRLRDWFFSRRRYWGEPFPIVWDEDGLPHASPEEMLPVDLPEITDYSPRIFDSENANTAPEAPLSRAEEWVKIELDLGDGVKTYRRETNTMPQWVGSRWCEIRYTDPKSPQALADQEDLNYWMGSREGKPTNGADPYAGGVEHVVLYLLHVHFWQKVLFGLGYVPDAESYHTLFNQGYVQAYTFKDVRGQHVPTNEAEGEESSGFTYGGEPVTREYDKIGKSPKNIVTPDEVYDVYRVGVFRVYEMSMGPLDVSRPWETRATVGSQRFLQRLWRNTVDEESGEPSICKEPADLETKCLLAHMIADVTVEYENMRVNTAISEPIVLNNHLTGPKPVPREIIGPLILMLSPVTPHIAEELWMRLGHSQSLTREPLPIVEDESLLVEDSVTTIVQVNGKVRAKLEVPPSISEDELREQALAQGPIVKILDGRDPVKIILRAPSLMNLVVPRG